MDRQQITRIKQELAAERRNLVKRVNVMEEDSLNLPLQESVSELSSYDNHPADLGSEVFERSKDLALREGLEIHMNQIDQALDRIEEGTYGICETCGRPIPEERLQALPTASKCIQCKEKEQPPDRHPRPIEEDVVVPPFGGFTHDNSYRELGDSEDDNAFDGEDTFQTFARWSDHASDSRAGAYYGGMDEDEDVGYVEDIDHIVYERGADGMIYGTLADRDNPDYLLTQDDLPADEKEPYSEAMDEV